jgi:hypothetical protein
VFEVNPGQRFGWRPGATALAEIARGFMSRRLRRVEVRHGAGARLAKARAMRQNAKTIIGSVPDPAVMVDHFERRFREMLENAQARVPRVIVVRQPWFRKAAYESAETAAFWHGARGDPYAGEVTTYYSFDVVSRLVELVDRRAERVASDVGVEQIDLMPVLDPSLRTFYDFWHFTPAGAAAVGKAVAAVVGSPPVRGGARAAAATP